MNFNKFLKTFIVFLLVFSWIFSGWPQIWKKPPIPPEVKEIKASPDTLILRPNAAGTYQQWSTFGDTVHWSLTSDQNDNTGVQVTGTTTLKETENLADTTQAGTINSVTAYMRAKASSSTETYTLYAHQETITIAGTTYYLLKTTSADAAGTTFATSVGSTGYKLFGKWVYQLTDVISIPASTWTVYYRAYTGGGTVYGVVDILIRKSDGTTRTTIATKVATSSTYFGTSWGTYSGTYSFPGYTVVDQTDYLEIDFYANVTASKAGKSAYLRIDDNTLAPENQTRVEGVSLDYSEKAVIVWRTHSTDYESSATIVSRTAFTDYSETRTVNPYTGSAWTWDEVNNLEIGARATQLGSADTIQVSEFWIVVDYVANQPPTVSNVSLNGGNPINLTENTTTLVTATGTVSDPNGYQDITSVICRIYRSGVTGGENCTLDANNCYEVTGATSSCAGNSCTVTCNFNVWFHADPTDTGSPWASEYWVAWIKAIDSQNASSSATNTTQTVDVNTLLALDVTLQINYGTMLPGDTINPLSVTSTATTTGNAAIDVQLSGTNMTSGANSIPVSQQRYATSTVAYSSGYTLTTSPTLLELTTGKPTTHPSNQAQNIYWGIQIPLGTPIGSYSGQITFTAVAD
jgi:hypothetical protein